MAYNLHNLHQLKWVMETSLAKTLARKHQISVAKVYQKYQANLDIQGKSYKGLQVTVPREGKKPLVATWGGIPLKWDVNASIEDPTQTRCATPPELQKRLLPPVCHQHAT